MAIKEIVEYLRRRGLHVEVGNVLRIAAKHKLIEGEDDTGHDKPGESVIPIG